MSTRQAASSSAVTACQAAADKLSLDLYNQPGHLIRRAQQKQCPCFTKPGTWKSAPCSSPEDKGIIEAQYNNQVRQGSGANIDIHVDAGPNRARRLITRLRQPAVTV